MNACTQPLSLGKVDALVRARPALGGREAQAGELTDESIAEQAADGSDRLTRDQLRRLRELNRVYRDRLGFPPVISVRGRERSSSFDEGEVRRPNSSDQELDAAITHITRIGSLRLHDLVVDSDGRETSRLPIRGK